MDHFEAWRVPGYTSVRELGSGAFGRVMLSVRQDSGAQVAVKYLSDQLVLDERFRSEFRAEARLLSGLRSTHVAQLREYVESEDGAAIVMELVDGVSLRQVLKAGGATSPEAALAVLKGSLLGLADAHDLGVVHRDYKPENVLVAGDGVSKLVDFGIAVRSGSEAGAAGTPTYMPPEQWHRGHVSPAGDVYSATAVFFECLTGHKPYEAPTLPALAVQHAQAPIPYWEAPEPIQDLIRWGLAKDPADRPPTASVFVAELQAVADAAYGPDWERRGLYFLAAGVVAVAALLPIAATVGGDRAEVPAEQAVSRLGGSRQGVLKTAAGKAVAGAVATVVAVTAIVLIKTTSGDTRPVAHVRPTSQAPVDPSGSPSPGPTGTEPATVPPTTAPPTTAPPTTAPPVMVAVPDVVKSVRAAAEAKIKAVGLMPYVKLQQTLEAPAGTVIATTPAAGASVEKGSAVSLLVAQAEPVTKVPVPDLSGLGYDEAVAVLADLGLTAARVDTVSATAPAGQVISSNPAAGAQVEKGTRVTLTVAKAPVPVTVPVPPVVGEQYDKAAAAVSAAGLVPARLDQESATVPPGQVISSNPAAGVRLEKGKTVTLTVAKAKAPETVPVPAVAGETYEKAAAAVREAGLVPVRVDQESENVTPGQVISSNPAAGVLLEKGKTVTLTVAKAVVKTVPVPNVVGDGDKIALRKLTAVGLKVNRVTKETNASAPNTVISSNPGAGTKVEVGSTVTIIVAIPLPTPVPA